MAGLCTGVHDRLAPEGGTVQNVARIMGLDPNACKQPLATERDECPKLTTRLTP